MREFSIYQNSKGSSRAVKNGWCWPAFFFGSLWSLFSGFFLAAIIMLPIELVLNIASNGLERGREPTEFPEPAAMAILVIALIGLGIRLVYGARGNKWRKARYLRGGFEFRGVVRAENKAGAVKSHAR
ncbi:DUF2628 domain-containing protein [Sphingobium sp. MI1205]|uniref:DUF2628 domain-containing protein n=1 Tax=unclassified Sphingobium TaxID=2611147 RepID=UPI0009F859A5